MPVPIVARLNSSQNVRCVCGPRPPKSNAKERLSAVAPIAEKFRHPTAPGSPSLRQLPFQADSPFARLPEAHKLLPLELPWGSLPIEKGIRKCQPAGIPPATFLHSAGPETQHSAISRDARKIQALRP